MEAKSTERNGFHVLDHGYIELVSHMGSDEEIIESARMSTGKGFLGWGPHYQCYDCKSIVVIPTTFAGVVKCKCGSDHIEPKTGDEKLLRHLYKNNHTSPFEMCEITFEVQAPIFVFREWHRHRTQSYNEFSARYSKLPAMFYIPSRERMRASVQSTSNKQSSQEGFSDEKVDWLRNEFNAAYLSAAVRYETLLNQGVAKEIARLVMPVATYSKMRAKANLLNWIRFLRLRMPNTAQYEIRQYAWEIYHILSDLYPRTMSLFREEYDAAHSQKMADNNRI